MNQERRDFLLTELTRHLGYGVETADWRLAELLPCSLTELDEVAHILARQGALTIRSEWNGHSMNYFYRGTSPLDMLAKL